MKSYYSAILTSIILLGISQLGWAVMPTTGIIKSSNTPAATATPSVQRGGKITAIDTTAHTISVDKTVFPLQTPYIPIHSLTTLKPGNLSQLGIGNLIRFNTVRSGMNGKEVINEIWIEPPTRLQVTK